MKPFVIINSGIKLVYQVSYMLILRITCLFYYVYIYIYTHIQYYKKDMSTPNIKPIALKEHICKQGHYGDIVS